MPQWIRMFDDFNGNMSTFSVLTHCKSVIKIVKLGGYYRLKNVINSKSSEDIIDNTSQCWSLEEIIDLPKCFSLLLTYDKRTGISSASQYNPLSKWLQERERERERERY